MLLAQAAKPPQEKTRLRRAFLLRQQTREEDGQLIQNKKDAGFMISASLDERFAPLPPIVVSGGAYLHA